jgi:general secretion pathway protein G
MKSSFSSRRGGFTLIELLAVITIIVILAGLVIAGLSFVQDKQSREKTKLQIALIGKALEEYKLDKGSYPSAVSATGAGQSNILFKALYLDGANDGTKETKIYLAELDPSNGKQGWVEGGGAGSVIKDPWGSEFRYRTGADAVNPDFDIWSVGKDGKTSSSSSSQNDKDNRDDIRNF